MAEQLKQNNTRIAYVVSSGNYHRKVYMTATCNSTRDVQTTTPQYTGRYYFHGTVDISGTFYSTSTYLQHIETFDDVKVLQSSPIYPFMTEQHGTSWSNEDFLPMGGYDIQASASTYIAQQTTTQQSYTTTTNQLYVLKSYSKAGIKVDITALTTNASSKSTYTGSILEYRITSSRNTKTSSSGKTLTTTHSTVSHETFITKQSTLISSSSRGRNIFNGSSYFTYSSTYTGITVLDTITFTQYYSTSLSEYNNQSYTTFTTNRSYTGTVPSYNVSNTYPYISFTTTGNIWNVTLNGHVNINITTTSVPDYGTLSSKQKVCFFDYIDEVAYTYTFGKSYTSMLSSTTTFTSYVSSTTY